MEHTWVTSLQLHTDKCGPPPTIPEAHITLPGPPGCTPKAWCIVIIHRGDIPASTKVHTTTFDHVPEQVTPGSCLSSF